MMIDSRDRFQALAQRAFDVCGAAQVVSAGLAVMGALLTGYGVRPFGPTLGAVAVILMVALTFVQAFLLSAVQRHKSRVEVKEGKFIEAPTFSDKLNEKMRAKAMQRDEERRSRKANQAEREGRADAARKLRAVEG